MQCLQGVLTQTTLNGYIEQEIILPSVPTVFARTRNTVLELLYIRWGVIAGFPDPTKATTHLNKSLSVHLCQASRTQIQSYADVACLFRDRISETSRDTDGSYAAMFKDFYEHTWNDGAGHGILCAAPRLYFALDSAYLTLVASVTWQIAYRYKSVAVNEYVNLAGQATYA